MNPVIQFKRSTPLSLFGLALFCFAPAPLAQAVVPVPDGGYPGGNTAEGQSALLSLTTGTYNTAVGLFALLSNTSSGLNTAVGAGALLANTSTSGNTAVGAGALLNSTGFQNTATGTFALFNNIAGGFNTAVGHGALCGNISGSGNTALGTGAGNNATGDFNVYVGAGMNGVPGESNTIYIRNIYDSVAVTRQVYVNSDNKIGTLTALQGGDQSDGQSQRIALRA
jgi:trimeric autotransporter adhesin